MRLRGAPGWDISSPWGGEPGQHREPCRDLTGGFTWPTVLPQAGARAEALGVPSTSLLLFFPLNLAPPVTGTFARMSLLALGEEVVWGEVQLCFQHLSCAGPQGKVQ